jgi:hypothetical protein
VTAGAIGCFEGSDPNSARFVSSHVASSKQTKGRRDSDRAP